MTPKKIFVSGCFDLLHSGHIAFFEEASSYGDVYVGLGSDKTISDLKNRPTVFKEEERLYMVKSIRYVKDAWINKGSGVLDFEQDIKELKPDILFVNEDGDAGEKKKLCKKLGIEYIVSKRVPKENLKARSSTDLRIKSNIPYRLDLAGGWLDQPYVSKHYPGPVITICIEPDLDFNDRSGMSSSTRKKAIEIWGKNLPDEKREKLAKILFSFENPPGKTEISGSQDSIGIVFPGLNILHYDGKYWPESIESCFDESTLTWIENRLFFLPLSPRVNEFDVLSNTRINPKNAESLALATEGLWEAIMKKDTRKFGEQFRKSFEAQITMFPNMITDEVLATIEEYKNRASGWKLSGAGGGGYLVLVSEKKIPGTFQIRIRRSN
jgi:cytidyltransferase-like protein